MGFSPLLPTNQGLEALAEVPTGSTLVVTGVQAGSGYTVGGDVQGNFTALKEYVMDADSTSTNTLVLYQTTIKCTIDSSKAPQTFQLNEFGVFASLNGQAPFLFAYSSTGAPNGDTVDPGAPIIKDYVLPIVYATTQQVTTSITMTDVVGLHGNTHLPSGVDPLPIAGSSVGGLCPKTLNDATEVLLGGASAAWGPLPIHGPTHVSTGRDPVPVATTTATGLLPELSGNNRDVLHGDATWSPAFLPGFIIEYGGQVPPTNWLLCDGAAYAQSLYPNLYAALGGASSPWGVSGTTFNVPDLRGRVTIGMGQGAGLTNRLLAAKGGEETHTLTVNELPAHAHSITDSGHAHSVYDGGHIHTIYDPKHTHNYTDPGHTHPYSKIQQAGILVLGAGTFMNWQIGDTESSTTGITITKAGTGISINSAVSNISINSAKTGITAANTGSGWAHNNLQPFVVINKIIHI